MFSAWIPIRFCFFLRNQFVSEIHLHPNSLAFNCICNFTYNSCHFKFKFNSILIAIQFHLHLNFTYNLICDSFAFTCIHLNSLPSKNTNLHPKFNFCHHMDHFGWKWLFSLFIVIYYIRRFLFLIFLYVNFLFDRYWTHEE